MEDEIINEKIEFLYKILNEVTNNNVHYGINVSDDTNYMMPFIVYQEINKRGVTYADDRTLVKISVIQITLVTNKKDLNLENLLEQALNSNGFEYQMLTEYLNNDNSINRVYEIRMEVINNE